MNYDALLSEFEKQKKIKYIKAILSGEREEEILKKLKKKEVEEQKQLEFERGDFKKLKDSIWGVHESQWGGLWFGHTIHEKCKKTAEILNKMQYVHRDLVSGWLQSYGDNIGEQRKKIKEEIELLRETLSKTREEK